MAAMLASAGCRTLARPGGTAPEPLSGLVAADLGTQHLFHVHGRRDGADLRLRLALRIWSAQVFDLAASDPFGRALWRLEIGGDGGVFLDLRTRQACRFDPSAPIRLPGFAVPFAATDLAPLLLGRLPLDRARGQVRARRSGDEFHLVIDAPPIELEWREAARARVPGGAIAPATPDPDLPLCADADFS
jgi:hypothetical protein